MKKIISWESQHYSFDNIYGKLQNKFTEEEDEEVKNMMNTPFGIWSVDDSMNPFKQFKFWMGHTNFSIGRNGKSIIKRVGGVEVLKILTRYRFLIGVGELYNIRDVRTNIEFLLCGSTDDCNLEKE